MASKKSKQDALIDELLQSCDGPKDILGKNGRDLCTTQIWFSATPAVIAAKV